MTWLVYILECADNTLYTGITNNLDKRIEAHNNKQGAKYTKPRTPVKLVYSENCGSKSDASKREYQLKQLTRDAKIKLIKEGL